MNPEMPTGRSVRAARRRRRMSPEELSNRSGASVDLIRELEQGQRRTPHRDAMTTLADALDRDAAEVWETLGLGPQESAVYQVLLSGEALSTETIAARSGMPVASVAASLGRLHEGHQVAMTAQGRWRCLSPRVGLGAGISRRRAELAEAEDLIEALHQLWLSRQQGDPDPATVVEVLNEPDAMAQRLAQLRDGTSEDLGLDQPPYFESDQDWRQVTDELRRPVSVRTIYSRAALARPGKADKVLQLSRQRDLQARMLPELPLKLTIFDRQTALLVLTDDEHARVESFVVLHGRILVRGLHAMFETLWQQAIPIPQPDEWRASTARPLDRQILQLMAMGLSDAFIADRLGISARTLSRHIARLLHDLRATNRFQAGFNAARRAARKP